ncbi:unnamed protein product [Miscanthus lutarioriparius]|uniref:Uncharacterized protein n=1 Tax=Miscanthus lutarioriparius TaxID=422564 RepID=A0A811N531_9POAL|nr:unnamed protein product [Miscanthus lutarioriparius]
MEAAAATALPVTAAAAVPRSEPGLRSRSQRRRPSPLPGGSHRVLPGPVVSLCLVRAGIHGSLRLVRDGPAVQETKAAAVARVAAGGLTAWPCGSSRCCHGVLQPLVVLPLLMERQRQGSLAGNQVFSILSFDLQVAADKGMFTFLVNIQSLVYLIYGNTALRSLCFDFRSTMVHGNYYERFCQTPVSTLAVKHNLLVTGGFHTVA